MGIENFQVNPAGNQGEAEERLPEILPEFRVSAEKQEEVVTPEIVRGNVERLQANLQAVNNIPEEALRSPEGQEHTQSLRESLTDKVKNFGQGIADKIGTLGTWSGQQKLGALLGGASFAAIAGPLVVQIARSKWPEVGMVLDAAPDIVQSFVHMDIWNEIASKVTDGQQHMWVWDTGNKEGMNLLADISSGRIDPALLDSEKQDILQKTLSESDLSNFTHYVENPRQVVDKYTDGATVAERISHQSSLLKTMANAPVIGAAAFATHSVLSKIGTLAGKFSKKA